MKLFTIVADSVAEALAEVNRKLGPNAVIVNVRKTSSPGLSRIWKKPQIEVQAGIPSNPAASTEVKPAGHVPRSKQGRTSRTASRLRSTDGPDSRQFMKARQQRAGSILETYRKAKEDPARPKATALNLDQMLENLGLLPLHVQWLTDQLRQVKQTRRIGSLREEFVAIQNFLVEYWNRLAKEVTSTESVTRILLGTPGVGKTTCICKWLTQLVLLENKGSRIWRLDGAHANTAEFLSIHGEILGVPVERVRMDDCEEPASGIEFVDLPGIPATDASEIESLNVYVEQFQSPEFYLVLNAAYDLGHLLDHVKAFSVLPLSGLILTHLDEDRRWGKFWNLLLGARLPVLYLSADQNIPGTFCKASPKSLFDISGNQDLGFFSDEP